MLSKALLGAGALCIALLQIPQNAPPPLIPPFKPSRPLSGPPSDDLHDNSDWFSGLRPSGSEGKTAGEADDSPLQEREISSANFRILGVELSPAMFKPIEEKFGSIHTVLRGDASSGRSQACYVSTDVKSKIHLIFEQGEVDSSMYLFAGGPDWYGSNRCIPSKLVSEKLTTASGLRLGLSPAKLLAILGQPSDCEIPVPFTTSIDADLKGIPYPCDGHRPVTDSAETRLRYSFHQAKSFTEQECAKALRTDPETTPQDARDRCVYDLNAGVDAYFTNGRLSFLAVSVSETN